MKERFVLPREIQKQSEEFMDLMDTFAALKGQQHVDRTAKTKSAAVAKKLMAFVHHWPLTTNRKLQGGWNGGRNFKSRQSNEKEINHSTKAFCPRISCGHERNEGLPACRVPRERKCCAKKRRENADKC